MPEIMRQFGQTIVVAVAAALLFTLLFVTWPGGGSILDDIGSRGSVQLEERAVTGGVGSPAFDEHSGRSLPVAVGNGTALQGDSFLLADKFKITSTDGGVWDQAQRGFMLDGINRGGLVQIESIVSTDGTEHVGGLVGDYATTMLKLSQSTGTVQFLEPGVYRVRLRVMDHDNIEASYTIPLVVDFVLHD